MLLYTDHLFQSQCPCWWVTHFLYDVVKTLQLHLSHLTCDLIAGITQRWTTILSYRRIGWDWHLLAQARNRVWCSMIDNLRSLLSNLMHLWVSKNCCARKRSSMLDTFHVHIYRFHYLPIECVDTYESIQGWNVCTLLDESLMCFTKHITLIRIVVHIHA